MSGLILASASVTRAQLLRQAGVDFEAIPPRMDEEALKQALRANAATPREQVIALSEAKALSVSRDWPDRIILGCDQMLLCDEQVFDKPRDRADAHRQLRALSGKPHVLLTGAVLAQGGVILWHTLEEPLLTMRDLGEAAIESYLHQVGELAFASVGGYQVEGLGVQLFSEISGDWFSILGLPLLPILNTLRRHDQILR